MEKSNKSSNFIVQIIKGVFTTLIVMLVAVFLFAWIVKLASLNYGVIKAVNQFIKVLAVFIGCFFSLRESKGLIKGLLVGALSAVLISLIFVLISSEASFGIGFFIDIIFISILGAISGIISVNIRK